MRVSGLFVSLTAMISVRTTLLHDQVLNEYRKIFSSWNVLGFQGMSLITVFALVVTGCGVISGFSAYSRLPLASEFQRQSLAFAIGVAVYTVLLFLGSNKIVSPATKVLLERRYKSDRLLIRDSFFRDKSLSLLLLSRFRTYLRSLGIQRADQMQYLARTIRDSHIFRLRNSPTKLAVYAIGIGVLFTFSQIVIPPLINGQSARLLFLIFVMVASIVPTLAIVLAPYPWIYSLVDNCIDLLESLAFAEMSKEIRGPLPLQIKAGAQPSCAVCMLVRFRSPTTSYIPTKKPAPGLRQF
jgi:hypothetical protein